MKKNKRESILGKDEYIPLTFGYVFEAIFNNKDNIDLLESFFDAYFLKEKGHYKNKVKLLNRELPTDNRNDRDKQVDILLQDDDGNYIEIEMSNNTSVSGVIDRNIIYLCYIHSKQLHYKDNDYSNIKKSIQICLNSKYDNKNKLIRSYLFREQDGEILSNKVQIDMVDMELGSKMCYDESSKYYRLANWCKLFLTNSKEIFSNILESDIIMTSESKNKLTDAMDYYSSDNETIQIYTKLSKQEMEHNTILKEDKKIREEDKKLREEYNQLHEQLTNKTKI